MPEAGDEEHDEHAHHRRKAAHTPPDEGQPGGVRPDEGGEEIVLQPAGKADVPAAPEAGEVGGEEGGLEVFGDVQPQQKGAGPGHLGIAREVEIEIKGVAHRGRHKGRAAVASGVGVDGLDVHHDDIRHRHLFEKTQGKQLQTPHGAGGVKAVLGPQLGQHLPCAADGAGGDGAEKAEEGREVHKVFFRLHVAPGHVHQIAHGGEGVEADAQGEGQGVENAGGQGQHRQKEVEVFEHRQHRQKGHDGGSQQPAPLAFFPAGKGEGRPPDEEAHRRQHRQRHQRPRAGPVRPGGAVRPVEQNACRQEQPVLEPGRADLQMQKSRHGQERKVGKTLKTHPGGLLSARMRAISKLLYLFCAAV